MLFMGILIVALTNFIVGSIIGPADIEELSKGFFGYNSKLILSDTEKPAYDIFHLHHTGFSTIFRRNTVNQLFLRLQSV